MQWHGVLTKHSSTLLHTSNSVPLPGQSSVQPHAHGSELHECMSL